MARSIEEMDIELRHLRAEVEALKRRQFLEHHPLRSAAGTLPRHPELDKILDAIEAERKVPDPGFGDE